jgi:FtsP/CotA-like multicopper oxidase with cupredoxin domain
MVTRRDILKTGAIAGAASFLPWKGIISQAFAYSQSANLLKFVQPLRDVTSGGIPIAASDGTVPYATGAATHYSLALEQFEDLLHPNLPNPTRLWGYRSTPTGASGHLGGIIVANRGTPVQITATNALPASHILPVDQTIMGAEAGQPENRATIHLHGGFVPWVSDGGPHTWFDPAGGYGASVVGGGANTYQAVNPGLLPGQAEYYYPNAQGARMMWYHDHAIGITRLNAYAGLASAYVITDAYEASLTVPPYNVPGPLDPRTKYLVFQDKIFVDTPAAMALKDPTWFTTMPNSRAGDLWYAHVYEPALWMLGAGQLLPAVSVIPEFFGDTMLVNGAVAPFLQVEQRQYRFRLLNACNARFLNPRLVFAQGATGVAATEPKPNAEGPAFIQIGTEGGFLPAPVMVNGPKQPVLLLGPAERADLIVDFSAVPAGSTLILYNDAPAPFPRGSTLNDYYPGNSKTPASIPGSTPNTRTLLQIRVVARTGAADAPITLPATAMQNPLDAPFLVTQVPGVPNAVPAGVPVRRLTLNEAFDLYGRLIQLLGTDQPPTPPVGKAAPAFGRGYDTPPTETVLAGSTEVWEIVNTTADTHPMHFHLVNVQVLSRQVFSKQYVGGVPNYQNKPMAPDLNELGWKETVRMNPGEVTRVIMKFDLPATPFAVPVSPRTGANEYVWHCHILEHEEHDMMRPLVVT